MITDPVTTPTNNVAKVFFALFLGALTVLFRFVGSLPEGVGTALIVMNIFAIPIDTYSGIIRTKGLKQKTGISYAAVLVVILILLLVYTLIASNALYTASLPTISTWGGLI
jgi:hypothetical protein